MRDGFRARAAARCAGTDRAGSGQAVRQRALVHAGGRLDPDRAARAGRGRRRATDRGQQWAAVAGSDVGAAVRFAGQRAWQRRTCRRAASGPRFVRRAPRRRVASGQGRGAQPRRRRGVHHAVARNGEAAAGGIDTRHFSRQTSPAIVPRSHARGRNVITQEEFDALARAGHTRIPLVREVLSDLDTPLSVYLKLADGPYTFLFESVAGGENWGRYSIIGLPAQRVFRFRERTLEVEEHGEVIERRELDDPFAEIETLRAQYTVPRLPQLPAFTGGLVGYFG